MRTYLGSPGVDPEIGTYIRLDLNMYKINLILNRFKEISTHQFQNLMLKLVQCEITSEKDVVYPPQKGFLFIQCKGAVGNKSFPCLSESMC